MKKLFAFIVAIVLSLGLANANTLKVGMSMDYPPFEFINDQNEPSGFDVELINAISKKAGFEVKLLNISFDGLIPALKAGKIDAVMSAMSATEDRKKSVDFSDSYYATENLFIRKIGSDINENNMAGKKIGVQLGTVQEAAANLIAGAKVVPSDNMLGAIMGLKAGKVDLVLVDSSIGYGYIRQNSDLEEFLKLPDGSEGFSIAFDKDKKTELITKINQAIKELKADGTFDKILEKYELK